MTAPVAPRRLHAPRPAAPRLRQRQPPRPAPDPARVRWEAEASAAATAAARDRPVGALTPAPTAAVPSTAGSGAPLSAPIRKRLERAFRADVGAVRVHTDAAARAAARAHDAAGFAAGNHVFLDVATADLASEPGFALLAHEIAHALQQTARVVDGRTAVTDRAGHGPVQLSPVIPDLLAKANMLVRTSPTFEELKTTYVNAFGPGGTLGAEITAVETALGTDDLATAPAATKTAIVARVFVPAAKATTSTPATAATATAAFAGFEPHVQGFYLDVFTALGLHAEALELQGLNQRAIPTRSRSLAFYEHARGAGATGIAERIATIKELRDFFPGNLSDAYRITLFGTGQMTVPLQGEGKLGTAADAAANARSHGATPGNEFDLAAAGVLVLYDEARKINRRHDAVDAARADKIGSSPAADLRAYAEDAAANPELWLPAGEPEFDELTAVFAPTVAAIGKRAAAYWAAIARAFEVLRTDDPETYVSPIGTLGPLTSLASGLGVHADTAQLDPALAKELAAVLAEPGKAPPLPASVKRDRTAGATRLAVVRQALGLKVIDLARKTARPASTGKPAIVDEQSEAGVRLGLAIQLVRLAELSLNRYDPTADEAWRTTGALDYWISERVQLARFLDPWSTTFGLVATASAIAKFQAPSRADLALLGTWRPSYERDRKVTLDFDTTEIYQLIGTGLTIETIDLFGHALYFELLTRSIRDVLGEWLDFSARDKTLFNEASDRADLARTRPRCYVMDQAYWYLGEDATTSGATPRRRFLFDLILSHPRARELEMPDSMLVTSSSRSRHEHYGANVVFVWELPGMDLLVEELQGDSTLDQRVRTHWTSTKGTDPPAIMDWRDWLDTLGGLTTALKAAGDGDPANKVAGDPAARKDQEALAALVTGRITARHDTASSELATAERDASTYDRKLVETSILFPALGRYDRRDISRYGDENTIRSALIAFARNVRPESDQPLQVATMVLESARHLQAAFGDEGGPLGTGVIREYGVIKFLLPLVSGAASTWDDPALQPQIEALSWMTREQLDDAAVELRKLRGSVHVAADGQRSGNGLVGRIEGLRRDWRMIGSAAKGEVAFPSWKATFKVGDEHQFLYEGKWWNLKAVHTAFVWLPPMPLDPLRVPWPHPTTAGASLLFESDGVTPIARTTPLLTVGFADAGTFTVEPDRTFTGQDAKELEKLSAAVVVSDIAQELAKLGESIEWVTERILDVLEFIPGMGPALMALRFVQNIVRFLTDAEFQELLALFKEDGLGAIGKILGQVETMFDVETLLMWLLFRSGQLPFTAPAATKPKNPVREQMANKAGKFAVVGKVVRNVLGFGKNLVKSVERVRVRAQGPVRGMRLWVLEHPMASLLLDFMFETALPQAMLTVELLTERSGDDPAGDGDIMSALGGAVAESIEGILQGAADSVAALAFLELPQEVIPMEPVVEFLLDQVIQRLGTKYSVALKIARGFLEALNVYKDVKKAISDGIGSIGGDPNDLYRHEVKTKLQPHLDKVRTTFLEKLHEYFGQLPFVKDLGAEAAPKAPASEAIALEFHGDEFPESQASVAADDNFPDLSGPLPYPSGGEPLPGPTRALHESAFGSDFSHVRLHTGADAAAVTSRFHADGLTTGSHVYVRPTLDPHAGAGAQVLAHELSHVRDQTGARSLGATHDDRPAVGAPGRGVVWDPASEARAEAAAHGHIGSAAEPAAGAQPSVTVKFLTDFVKELKNPNRLEKPASRAKEVLETTASFSGDPAGKRIATRLESSLRAAFADSAKFTISESFDAVREKLVTYLSHSALGEAMPHLVVSARTTVKLKKMPNRDAEAYYISPVLLDAAISEFLYRETGLAVQLKVATVKDDDLDNRDAVNPNDPIKAIDLVYLHVPFMHGTAGQELLVDAAKATWPAVTSAEEQGLLVGIAGLLVSRLGPRPDIWDATSFKFHRATKRRIEEQQGSLGKVVKATHWPTPSQYVETDPSKVKDDGGVSATDVVDIGLRLGTYATWGPAGKSGSPDRDAHHITQYVFFQYLSNAKMLKPFPTIIEANRTLLGIKPASGSVASIEAVGTFTHKAIDVAKYEAGRGGEMATIYIARNTHRSDVHLRGEPPDDDGKRESQGATVDRIFRAGVREALNIQASGIDVLDHKATLVALAGAPKPDTPVKTPAGTFSRVDVNKAVFSATRQLYTEMAGDMNPRLKRAMADQEVAYYNLVAAQRKQTATLAASQIDPVFKAVVARNQQVIGVDAGVDP